MSEAQYFNILYNYAWLLLKKYRVKSIWPATANVRNICLGR